jgi:hypothetical protein
MLTKAASPGDQKPAASSKQMTAKRKSRKVFITTLNYGPKIIYLLKQHSVVKISIDNIIQ